MSIIRKKYDEGGTELNKLKFTPTMGAGHLGKAPLVSRRIPNEVDPSSPQSSTTQTRADDLTRITKLFTRKEGIGYLLNNTTLNTAVDQSYAVKGTLLDKAKALIDVNRGEALSDTTRTLGSTLAQVPLAGTGTHFIKAHLFRKPNAYFNKWSGTTTKIGDPGSVKVKYGRDLGVNSSPSQAGRDSVNYQGNYRATEPKGTVDDYIKFYFEVLTPGEKESTFLHFRAFLDSFSDDYTGNWDSFNYIGRGEQFHTYSSFSRTLSVSFKSAVATKVELRPVYKKLVYLASLTAPTYSDNGVLRGTVTKLNIGDYLSDTPGFLTAVNYSWEPAYPFEIGLGKKETYNSPGINTDKVITQELPHVLNCSLSFTPIHTFTPQTGLHHYITNPEQNDSQFFPVQGGGSTSNTVSEQQQQNADAINNSPNFGALGSG